MNEAADKIAEGLKEALAVARGDVRTRISIAGAPDWATHLLIKARLQSGEEVELSAPVSEDVLVPAGAQLLGWAYDGPLPEPAWSTILRA